MTTSSLAEDVGGIVAQTGGAARRLVGLADDENASDRSGGLSIKVRPVPGG